MRGNGTKHIWINTELCKACWECIPVCPNNVIGEINFSFHKHAHIDNGGNCKGCMACTKVCPNKAIRPLKDARYGPGEGSAMRRQWRR